MTFCNVLRSGTLSSAARECHSLNWEWRRSATPFYHKEQCGSGTPFFRAGAALFSPSFFFSFFSWRSYFLLERMGEISSTKRLARRNFEIGLLLKFIYSAHFLYRFLDGKKTTRSQFSVPGLREIHRNLKQENKAKMKNCQNGTFEPVHVTQKKFWPKAFFWSIMKMEIRKNKT